VFSDVSKECSAFTFKGKQPTILVSHPEDEYTMFFEILRNNIPMTVSHHRRLESSAKAM
jgi:hypothetical protein